MPLAGLVISRLGAARTVSRDVADRRAPGWRSRRSATGTASRRSSPGLFLLGLGSGTWDVAMNVEGAEVERRLGHSIMSRFHAGFSVGTVAGALLRLGDDRARRLGHRAPDRRRGGRRGRRGPPAVRGFLPVDAARRADEGERRNPLKAWTEPRTLLIGLFVFAMAFTEGTGVDWLGVAVIDGYDAARRARLADVRGLPGGDDARPLVRPRAPGPPRPRAGDRVTGVSAVAGPGARRLRRLAARRDGRRRAVGRSASRSGSRSG